MIAGVHTKLIQDRMLPVPVRLAATLVDRPEILPLRLLPHRKENNQRVRFLSADEEARLMAVIRHESPEREVEILVALHSGMRRSEQYRTAQVPDRGLKWEPINSRAGVIRLPRKAVLREQREKQQKEAAGR